MNSSTVTQESVQIVNALSVFIPLVLAVFVIGLVSNILLLALICKARKVNNNTNVYLFSLGMTGLMRTFTAFTLIVTLAAGNWVLGKGICSINQLLMRISTGVTTQIVLAMSNDRYISLKYPFSYFARKQKKPPIITSIIWISSIIFGSPAGLVTVERIVDAPDTIWTECYSGTTLMDPEVHLVLTVLNSANFIAMAFVTVLTLIYFIATAKELRKMSEVRVGCSLPASSPLAVRHIIPARYKPTSIEKETVKSFASFVLFQSACSIVGTLLFFVAVGIGFSSSQGSLTVIFQLAYTLLLFFFSLPAISPFLLMLKNKKFRKKVRKLLSKRETMSPYKKHDTASSIMIHPISRGGSIFISHSAPSTTATQPATTSNIYTELGFLPGQIYV